MKIVERPPEAPVWRVQPVEGGASLGVSGDWIALSGQIPAFPTEALATLKSGQALAFTMRDVGRWDSGLIGFLWEARQAAAARDITTQDKSLPEAARKLLGLLIDSPAPPPAKPTPRRHPLAWIGDAALARLTGLGRLTLLLAATARAGAGVPFGRTRVRTNDIFDNLKDAGPAALPIVGVVNFLVGAILAFVGAAQLSKFAAGEYVANLVGLALVREMGPVMSAIVIAGRTGGAYAARIATMQGGEEIDALTVVGIPVVDYLVLPAILALLVTLPLLYLYGCLIGLFGGLVVATAMLGISSASYLHQTLQAVPLDQFVFGFVKCLAFAALIGATSCHIGLQAGRSSADVGTAATRAVVVGIVGVIALDTAFAVLANGLGI